MSLLHPTRKVKFLFSSICTMYAPPAPSHVVVTLIARWTITVSGPGDCCFGCPLRGWNVPPQTRELLHLTLGWQFAVYELSVILVFLLPSQEVEEMRLPFSKRKSHFMESIRNLPETGGWETARLESVLGHSSQSREGFP